MTVENYFRHYKRLVAVLLKRYFYLQDQNRH